MTDIKQDLLIRSENIQRVYQMYKNEIFLVNRKYQRKLVWNIEEKRAFVESIIKGYPVPLFLFAEIVYGEDDKFEIIDGMQRLNAISSFIEQEFEINGEYFDLETMVETKLLLDKKVLFQKIPKLSRDICTKIASYVLPFSVYKKENSREIDEIFRRINSGGRQLSKQDIRQSNSLGKFADVVRKISAKFRGDDSQSDELILNSMKSISISNKNLDYGINVNEIFWVKEGIIPREKVRQSLDEEIVADMLGYVLLENKSTANSELLDNYYGIFNTPTQKERYYSLERNLKQNSELIIERFIIILDELKKLSMVDTSKNLKTILYPDKEASYYIPRPFQIIFIAIYELIFIENLVIDSYDKLKNKLIGIGRHINISAGGNWSGASRKRNIEDIKALIKSAFRIKSDSDIENPAIDSWSTKLENILMQSFTEQALYDFKQGFHRLDNIGDFDVSIIHKITKTLTAMANAKANSKGYIIVGIADDEEDMKKSCKKYNSDFIKYNKFYITGLQGEVDKYHNSNYDSYYNVILNYLEKELVEKEFLDNVIVRLINYAGKALVIFEVASGKRPYAYDNKFYSRKGSNVEEIPTNRLHILFSRFS
ncbi:MAG TPA: DUF262 domain-containing protein [Pseudobacteroides sp.]|uniref:GmrSD restriction endonuclease domain-containing protein n=1 Tax=Pseudobacteroides sp. TaxID=1968840 RepID=UPI002F923A6B